ncbi:DMT family transporter [Rhizobium lusitanum]|uniref:Drug/metabolite transporter (DMT)-like permease n=1 Tax=Rhizobium lusitanum TaxID=293958 RepID=A0A7X0IVY5_9HYPH|nr:DMT family transporter [Rhizobium lusitanum]MBB6487844.1 drug/metabolite transporter (DMT)-like permease [Rhizobium lusitanum]
MTFQFPARSAFASDYERGVILVVMATLAWSCSGIYARLLTTDIWTAIAWRSLLGGVFLIVPSFFLEGGFSRRQWSSIFHPAGIAMIVCQALSQACFIGALYMTTVANVTMIYATAPFIAALLSWVLLRERVAKRTLVAGAVCLIGVAVIVASSIGGGTGIGDLLALGMTVTFAFIIVIPRMDRSVPILPSSIVSGFLTFVVFAPMASTASLDTYNWLLLAAFGATNFALAFVLFLFGSRRMPAADAALIGSMEIVLTPFWVWLFFSERPPAATFIGGAIIFATIVWHTAADLRHSRRARAPM